MVCDEAGARARPVQVVVMHQHKLAVLRLGDVDLHGARASFQRPFQRLDGVLGIVTRRPPPMADQQQPAGGAQAVETLVEGACRGGGRGGGF